MNRKCPEYLKVLNVDAIEKIVDEEGTPLSKIGNGPYYIEKSFRAIRDAVAEEQFERIVKAFGICYDEAAMKTVKKRFMHAVTGAGNEWMEINQLNSSALLSFLCFHAVGIEEGRNIKIGGTTYNDVRFEFRSPLNGSNSPSWMDVVLLNGKKALFLESKFTEYIKQTTRPLKISSYYNRRYKEVFCNTNIDLGDESHTHFKDNSWKADQPVYLQGVKQMICHYLGIIDQLKIGEHDGDWAVLKDYEEITLAEIVYDFHDGKKASYENTYRALSSLLNKHCKDQRMGNKKISVLDKLLTYQDVFRDNAVLLEDNVSKFYFTRKI